MCHTALKENNKSGRESCCESFTYSYTLAPLSSKLACLGTNSTLKRNPQNLSKAGNVYVDWPRCYFITLQWQPLYPSQLNHLVALTFNLKRNLINNPLKIYSFIVENFVFSYPFERNNFILIITLTL